MSLRSTCDPYGYRRWIGGYVLTSTVGGHAHALRGRAARAHGDADAADHEHQPDACCWVAARQPVCQRACLGPPHRHSRQRRPGGACDQAGAPVPEVKPARSRRLLELTGRRASLPGQVNAGALSVLWPDVPDDAVSCFEVRGRLSGLVVRVHPQAHDRAVLPRPSSPSDTLVRRSGRGGGGQGGARVFAEGVLPRV